ncbi:MAG: hypothetical protein SGJ00_00380 [bacterium]|nr:hypothetical protein [bacterium]
MNTKIIQWMAGFSFLLLLIGLWFLRPQNILQGNKAIYHWKTVFNKSSYTSAEDSFLNRHQIRKVYIKMLDVDYNVAAGIFPASKTALNYYIEKGMDSTEYVPVVYITNEVLKHLNKDNYHEFANNFLSQALRIYSQTEILPKEIQIDCDWTKATKDSYFNLLLAMKKIAPQFMYSVTLRLYPYKYKDELGVPPVDRVMLMLYNMENAKNISNINSIFNFNEALKYLKRKDYPLPMDVALPVFSWTLVFRNGMFLKVYSDNIVPKLHGQNAYVYEKEYTLTPLANNKFLVQTVERNGYSNYNLKAGDILKIESCGAQELRQSNLLLRNLPLTQNSTLALFDLDMDELNKITYENIEAAYSLPH